MMTLKAAGLEVIDIKPDYDVTHENYMEIDY